MPKFVALDSRQHRNLKIDPDKVEKQSDKERMVPVVINEFSKLIVHFPIVITKNTETRRFACVALLGFEEGENLFWESNAWNAIYTPLNIARQPLFIGTEKGKEPAVCINMESDCIVNHTQVQAQTKDKGKALFDEYGNDTEFLLQFKGMLAELIEGDAHTSTLIQALLDFDLLTPIQLEITFDDQSSSQIAGLYTIDEKKLENLAEEEFAVLRRQGMLKPIYIMIASISNIYALIQKKNQRLKG
ncbi:MAG: peptidase [Alteromonadaceae bacterium]|nr:MAG: peptidase [Alteromonadaceae bacterium]